MPLESILQNLEDIQKRRKEALEKSIKEDTPDNPRHLEESKDLKRQFEQEIEKLEDQLWPFKESITKKEFQEQYETQKEILAKNNLLEPLSNGELGIRGIDKKEYPFPKLEEITKQLKKENKEFLKTKMEQGFTEMQITPFANPIEKLTKAAENCIQKHHKENKLFTAKKDQDDPNEELVPLELDESQPIYVWGQYENADENGNLVYFPKQFDQQNHQGKTKQEILKNQLIFQGYLISFQERDINIPREGQAKEKGGRTQIDTKGTSIKNHIEQGKDIPSPEEYLEAIQKEQTYQGETGITPEEWLIRFITHLEKTNQIMDDYQGNGSASYNLAGYFPASGFVSHAVWSRDDPQACLGGNDVRLRGSVDGARFAVRAGFEI